MPKAFLPTISKYIPTEYKIEYQPKNTAISGDDNKTIT